MITFDILVVSAALAGLAAVAFWVRVASSRAVNAAFQLDGTEKLAERANRRAFAFALIATVLTVLLAALAFLTGRGAGAL